MTLRRRFRTDGRRLLDIADESLDGSIVDGAAVGDFLLEELERSRDVHMRDIVATIQADQYRLITHDPDGAARDPGRPGHRQDRRRPAPRVVAPLHAARAARSGAACSSSGRTARSWSTSRTSCRRSARTPSSSAPSASSSTASSRELRDPPDGRAAEGRPAAGRGDRPRGRAAARSRSRRSSCSGSKARSSRCASARSRELLAAARAELGRPRSPRASGSG